MKIFDCQEFELITCSCVLLKHEHNSKFSFAPIYYILRAILTNEETLHGRHNPHVSWSIFRILEYMDYCENHVFMY
jgi:hypothetical protein